MDRQFSHPRQGWERRVSQVGLIYHTPGRPYWDEHAYYTLTDSDVQSFIAAGNALRDIIHATCDRVLSHPQALAALLRNDRLPEDAAKLLPPDTSQKPIVEKFRLAWNQREGNPVLLGYSCGDITGLPEQAAQQGWSDDLFPGRGQFAHLSDAIEMALASRRDTLGTFHLLQPTTDLTGEVAFAGIALMNAAMAAGVNVITTLWDAVTYTAATDTWTDHLGDPIGPFYSPVPLADMLRTPLDDLLINHLFAMQPIEPTWQIVANSRGLLPILWRLAPGHPNLLPTYLGEPPVDGQFISFPQVPISPDSAAIYQAPAPYTRFGGLGEYHPEYDLWFVDGEPTALGIREYDITDDYGTARFRPHLGAQY